MGNRPRATQDHVTTPQDARFIVPAVVLVVCLYAVTAWLSARHINTLWDESNDLEIARALAQRPLAGLALDGTQARLPMYVTAGAFAVVGPSLPVARGISVLAGAAAVVLTFVLGRRWFSAAVGLLAAGLLAAAPYFLTFSRTAMTEGDAFCPAATLLALLAFDHYLARRDSVRLGLLAVALGLALAVKFYALFLLPPLFVCDSLETRRRDARRSADYPIRILDPAGLTGRGLLAWAAMSLGLESVAAVLTQVGFLRVAALFWVAGLLVLLAGAADTFLVTNARRYAARRLIRWRTGRAWLVILPLSLAVAAAVCPEHVLNPEILRSLARSVIHPPAAEPMVRILDPVRLYVGIILIKLGPPLGILSVAAMVWACAASPGHAGLSALFACFVLYLVALVLLPVRQSYYLMSIYPLLILMLAAFVARVARLATGHPQLGSGWLALVATAGLYLLWGVAWSYPDFGYYGYGLVRDRWLGAESRGYRNLIQVTNDGTEDALAWLAANVRPGRRVVSYLWDDHVIDRYAAGHPLSFHLVRREALAAREQPPEFDDADYLVVSLLNKVSYDDAPAPARIAERLDPAPVHTVWRGPRTARLPVVKVFARAADEHAPPATRP
jgi:hypothetical protein